MPITTIKNMVVVQKYHTKHIHICTPTNNIYIYIVNHPMRSYAYIFTYIYHTVYTCPLISTYMQPIDRYDYTTQAHAHTHTHIYSDIYIFN
jgi:hypothetical protein